ncbi:MAG: hypothetical protein SVW77_04020 [Candidatus Nanohaloarchaea archaeon]|nr:hypothetical protein [Candidatus Nanohaloarchaea archaeon]
MGDDTLRSQIEQALGDGWDSLNGGVLRFQHRETGSYLRVDSDNKTYEGRIDRPYRVGAGRVDAAIGTLDEEGYTGWVSSIG